MEGVNISAFKTTALYIGMESRAYWQSKRAAWPGCKFFFPGIAVVDGSVDQKWVTLILTNQYSSKSKKDWSKR
jgi:hypothetical protein